jgi:heptosyltransferase-2
LKHILVIQTAFIGDAILATSLLETLNVGLPDARIDLLLRKGNEGLFKAHPYVNNVLIWDKRGGKYRSLFSLLKQIRRTKYDCVINLQRYGATGLLTAFSAAKTTIGFDKNPFSLLFTHRYNHRFEAGIHEIDRNHLLAGPLTNVPMQKPKLYPTASDYQRVKEYQEHTYCCIAPTSVWFTKQFPVTQWAKLIGQLPSSHTIYLLGAPGDVAVANELIGLSEKTNVINLCGKLSFLESAALMEGALLNYVNDSAPMHLCSAVDAPVCAVYCSTVPEFGYGPLSTRSHIAQIEKKLPCRPCGIHGHRSCPEGHFECAHGIDTSKMTAFLS